MLQRLEHAEGLQDHELLEILLFNAIPRKNTNPLAHELLTSFPSMGELFRADYAELLNVDGVGPETAAYLRCIGLLMERIRNRRETPPHRRSFQTPLFVSPRPRNRPKGRRPHKRAPFRQNINIVPRRGKGSR